MDIFKQKRILVMTIVVLVLLNLVTIFLLWIGKPKPNLEKYPMPDHRKGKIEKLLQNELNFNGEQTERYIALREEHQESIMRLNEDIRNIKKEMFDQVLKDEYDALLTDSLLNQTLEKQRRIEELTFKHFMDLKKICNKDQEKKLMKIMHRIFAPPQPQRLDGPPQRSENRELPPPPGRNERPPLRN